MAKQPTKPGQPQQPVQDPKKELAYHNYQNKLDSLENELQLKVAATDTNPFIAARPYSFDSKNPMDMNKNFERYYSHPAYDKLGFNPWADNESLYNEQGGGDLTRASKAALKLMGTGFVSPLRSYADIFNGNPLAPDYESGREMAYANMVGVSTRGGVGGFVSNLVSNSGYTIGLMGEVLLESAALTALTGATGGAGAGVAAAKMSKNFGKISTAVQGIRNTLTTLNNYGAAKAAWQATKAVGKFVNPLENTAEAVAGIVKGTKGYGNLSTLAKTSKTAGAFFRDITMVNTTLSEAKMEGAMAEIDTEQELLAEFRRENRREPEQHELELIKDAAANAGAKTLAWNIPTIFLTNKITFDPLMKSFVKPSEFALKNGVKFMEKEGEGLVEATFKNRLFHSMKPKNLLTAPLKYFKENFSEGLL
jgi:hypothetical protein